MYVKTRRKPVAWNAIGLLFVACIAFYVCAKTVHKTSKVSGPRKVRVAIVLCKWRDKPVETRDRIYFRDFYTRRGTGGMADYWSDVTLGAIDLSASEVFGWFTMAHDSSEVKGLVFPGGRNTLVQWGRETAAANGVNLRKFDAVLVVQNWGVDHGAAGNGIVIVDRADLVEGTFIAHEMGHMLGLPHSCGPRGNDYGDPWDIMSAMMVSLYNDTFDGSPATFGPGLNAFGLRALGGLPPEREYRIDKRGFNATYELAPLNQPLKTFGHYAITIRRIGLPTITIEYRHRDRWDRALPSDAVLIHEEGARSLFLRSLTASEEYSVRGVKIEVMSIDAFVQKATVRVSDVPLR